MKKIFTILFFVFTVTLCKAQWVTIPDANFRNWLNTHGFSSCMSGTMMDTTCSAVVNATSINCISQNISDITGIQYFNSLTFLNCCCNHISVLPSLSNSLTTLYCNSNLLSNLPQLPNSLIYLTADNNNLTSIPQIPNSLSSINVHSNNITSLPNLPNSLHYLDCGSNLLSSLPALSASLTHLYCYNNQLTVLPQLPDSLLYLSCYYNQLTVLPTLSNSIISLDCNNNLLTYLPTLSNSLEYLDCFYNQLTILPLLPNSLRVLDAHSNQLISLPSLPDTLLVFKVSSNPTLSCLPTLNNFLGASGSFSIYNTGITCLPDVINHTGYIAAIDTMPICSCVTPTGISTSNITATSAKVLWNAECCNSYQIQYRIAGTNTWTTKVATPPAVSKTLTTLAANTTYDLRMRVKCTDGITYSAWSPIQTFTSTCVCSQPINISATTITQTASTINWTGNNCAVKYRLQYRKQGTTAWTLKIVTAPITTIILTGLTANTTYEYKLRSDCDATGTVNSGYTPTHTFTTLLRLEDKSSNSAIDFSVSPNPVNEQLTVICNQPTVDAIEIKDLLGRTCYSEKLKVKSENQAADNFKIDVSNLPSALYFISIRRNDGSILVKQFVKE